MDESQKTFNQRSVAGAGGLHGRERERDGWREVEWKRKKAERTFCKSRGNCQKGCLSLEHKKEKPFLGKMRELK